MSEEEEEKVLIEGDSLKEALSCLSEASSVQFLETDEKVLLGVFKQLPKHTSVKSLTFCTSIDGKACLNAFGNALKNSPSITHVTLESSFAMNGYMWLPDFLSAMLESSVLTLVLDEDVADEETAKMLLQFLCHPSCRLKSVCLNGAFDFTKGAVVLSEAISHKNAKLEHLQLSFCNVRTAGLDALAKALRSKQALKSLVINGSDFEDKDEEGAAAVSKLVEASMGLERLDLSECSNLEDSAKALETLVRKSSSLRVLQLRDCGLSPSSISAIATALVNNCHLRVLEVQENGESSAALVAAAQQITVLEKLEADLPENDAAIVRECMARNIRMHDRARRTVLMILAARKFQKNSLLSPIPKEIVHVIAEHLYATRNEWCWDSEPNTKSKKRAENNKKIFS